MGLYFCLYERGTKVLESLKTAKKAVGLKQCIKAVENGKAKRVFIAKDADAAIIEPLKLLCDKNKLSVIYVDSMKTLGKVCGIDVGASAACTLED
jgi:large subunit ribosomal protein L7A